MFYINLKIKEFENKFESLEIKKVEVEEIT
jgi:hypothetical protein